MLYHGYPDTQGQRVAQCGTIFGVVGNQRPPLAVDGEAVAQRLFRRGVQLKHPLGFAGRAPPRSAQTPWRAATTPPVPERTHMMNRCGRGRKRRMRKELLSSAEIGSLIMTSTYCPSPVLTARSMSAEPPTGSKTAAYRSTRLSMDVLPCAGVGHGSGVVPQETSRILGEVGDDNVRSRPLDAHECLQHGRGFVQANRLAAAAFSMAYSPETL